MVHVYILAEEKGVCETGVLDLDPVIIRLLISKQLFTESADAIVLDKML